MVLEPIVDEFSTILCAKEQDAECKEYVKSPSDVRLLGSDYGQTRSLFCSDADKQENQ